MKKTICVYGAAKDNIREEYKEASYLLGKAIADADDKLIFGGGSSGLMGATARGAKEANGTIIGVVPNFMDKIEPIFYDCTQIIRTETMGSRKEVMEQNADVFVILPGGVGTMDEFFQILTLESLNRTGAPILVYNIAGYYDHLYNFLQYMIEEGFVSKEAITRKCTFCNTLEEIMEVIRG